MDVVVAVCLMLFQEGRRDQQRQFQTGGRAGPRRAAAEENQRTSGQYRPFDSSALIAIRYDISALSNSRVT